MKITLEKLDAAYNAARAAAAAAYADTKKSKYANTNK